MILLLIAEIVAGGLAAFYKETVIITMFIYYSLTNKVSHIIKPVFDFALTLETYRHAMKAKAFYNPPLPNTIQLPNIPMLSL